MGQMVQHGTCRDCGTQHAATWNTPLPPGIHEQTVTCNCGNRLHFLMRG